MIKIINTTLVLVLTGILAFTLLRNHSSASISFSEYRSKFGLDFNSKFEEKYRQMIFENNVAKIIKHNSGNSEYKMGVNQFAHLTQKEFESTYLRIKPKRTNIAIDESFLKVDEVNWVEKGAVTRVKTQGECGSQWAFSATGALQGWWKITKEYLPSLSQQQLIDCSGDYGNRACLSGSFEAAFQYSFNHGLTTQNAYPYKATKQGCLLNSGQYKNSGYSFVSGCPQLAEVIFGRPVSVSVDAMNWSLYRSGIFTNCDTILNHDVLLVGVTDQYWLIKNSWSTEWGDGGYMKLARGNTCGICIQPAYPI